MRSRSWKRRLSKYWMMQLILLAPLFLLWLGVSYWYLNNSTRLLKTFFAGGAGALVVIVFGAASIVLGIVHLAQTPAQKQLDWMTSVALCLLTTFTLLALFGQMVN